VTGWSSKKTRKVARLLVISTLVAGASVLPSVSQAQQGPTPDDAVSRLWPKWGPFIDLDGKVGTKRDLGAVNLFVPFWQDERSMLFGDGRFRADNQGSGKAISARASATCWPTAGMPVSTGSTIIVGAPPATTSTS
jgi:hypothetical protein